MCSGAIHETVSERLFYSKMALGEYTGFDHRGELREGSTRPHGSVVILGESFGQYTATRYSAAERHLRQVATTTVVLGPLCYGAYELAQRIGLA